jgi:hypothetical protein
MKVFEHYKSLGGYPPHDGLNFKDNWFQFNDDPRTQNIDLHMGAIVDFRKIRSNKINVHLQGEWPNSWFNGRVRGQHTSHNLEIEKRFDHVLSFCKITCHGRGYSYAPKTFDFDHVFSQLNINDDFSNIKKDIDVFMCASWACKNPKTSPVWPWYQVMKKFNYAFCNQQFPGHKYPWHEKQRLSLNSKISIVFSSFIGATPECIEYARQNHPWIKFKIPDGTDVTKHMLPHPKGRIMDAAASKSLMLCYKDPFVNDPYPYRSAIEDSYSLKPDVDFIYFKDSDDLEKKIHQILDDWDNPKYSQMVESAYRKIKENHDIKAVYEKYLVPLSKSKLL